MQKLFLKFGVPVVLLLFSICANAQTNITSTGDYTHGDGLILTVTSFSGGTMTFGARDGSFGIDSGTTTTNAGLQGRWNSTWRINNTSGSGSQTATFTFDFGQYGFDVDPGTASNYRLISQPVGGGSWSIVSTSASVTTDSVVFSGISIGTTELVYTLGSNDTNDSPLPVAMLHYGAKQISSGKILVSWSTASETDCDRFEIKIPWTKDMEAEILAKIPGHGNSMSTHNYEAMIDVDPGIPANTPLCIEIWQHDFNGAYEVFRIPFLTQEPPKVLITPNPIEKETRTVEVTIPGDVLPSDLGKILILDQNGRIVTTKIFSENSVTIDLPNSVVSGYYFVQVENRLQILTIQRIYVN